MIYIDTNVFIDVLEKDRTWFEWSRTALARGRVGGDLVTGPLVLAELTRYASSSADLAELATLFGARVEPWSLEASFRAGRAYAQYRAAGGTRETILADILTGGHAASVGAVVLTRDPRRFRTYFPELELITPETDNG